jgi:ribonuclease-3
VTTARADVESLEERIGHSFANRELLRRALTHSSWAYDQAQATPGSTPADNEQLEFLGDSVLGFLISEMLVARFPAYPEGKLSKLKHRLVSAAHLLEVGRELEIGCYLQLGRSEEMSGGREKHSLLADALEALIAAIYLDGGMAAARDFVTRFVVEAAGPNFGLDGDSPPVLLDYKSALQELAQARRMPEPRYAIVRERGPSHLKTFTVEARVGKDLAATGEGMSKKSAAQQAARVVYERMLETASATK